ncbi:MAG: S9 family peptidase, partial [Calditrichales bacterium]
YDLKQEQVVRLTEGEWNVQDITCVNENDNRVYFHGSPENSTEKHLLCLDMNDRNLSDLTSDPGSHQAMVSPKGSFIIDSYSSITHPEKMVLAAVNGEVIRELGNRESEKMDSYNFGTVQLFKVPAGDGISLPAMWVLPPQRVTGQKFPVIISVYGGPGSQDVKNSYVSLHDNFYAQNGIIIFRVDHRGTAHFGKVGAKEMHRQLGKWEMHDLIAAVKWLREQPFVDAEKIGIRGTSYGGYVAALALTRGAEYFTYGFSGFPVTDWRLYDSMYTERYMDMPDENPQGYEDASVMNYVEEYNGHLQISHGGVDDNVHVQNTMQLADALLAHLKNFELLIYPNQFHGYRGNYRRHSQRNEVDFWFRHFFNREFELVHEGS